MDYFSGSHGGLPGGDQGQDDGGRRGDGNDFGGHAIDVFRAITVNGHVVLSTTDGHPFDSDLSTHPATTTIATHATSTHDTATLVSDLILWLNRGPWGGAGRGGHTLVVDISAGSGDLFKVF